MTAYRLADLFYVLLHVLFYLWSLLNALFERSRSKVQRENLRTENFQIELLAITYIIYIISYVICCIMFF